MKRIFLSIILLGTFCAAAISQPIIHVTTRHLQLSLQIKPDGRLYQCYLGPRLDVEPDEAVSAQPSGRLSSTAIKGYEAYPVMGTEDYYEPALEITHADGNPTSILQYVSHEQRSHVGGTETVVRLRDKVYPLSVTLHYVAYEDDDIIEQWSDISHDERGGVYLSRYASSMLYMEGGKYYMNEFSGDWAKEMQMKETELAFGKKIVDTRLGSRADMFSAPFFCVGVGGHAGENEGTVLMGTLGWTGNFRFTMEVDHDGVLRVISGINPDASRYWLPRGQTFSTPPFIFTLSQQGTGEGSRRFQRWAMNHRLYKGTEDRLTLLNNWENTGFQFDEEQLKKLFGDARDLGVDLFLLDDGWFGNKYPRNSDHTALGDWEANREKLPHGVPALVKAATDAGVGFGIWIEPEMVSPKSELAERHPDWIIRLPDREPYYFRHQLVLDLSNPRVQDHVFGVVDHLMAESPGIKFLKWDCNSPITNVYSPYEKDHQGNLYIDYVRGLCRVLDRIQQKYPQLRMMMCAGGGGRCDFGGLRYFTEFWCSDNTDPVERLYIQWGFSHFMPAKAMCAHVTDWNPKASVKFRLDVAFPYKLGFDIDLKKMKKEDLDYCRMALKEYNRLKPVIYSPLLYRIVSPYEGNHCVLQRVSEDRSHALVFAYDIHPRYGENLFATRLQGLDANAHYRIREICLMEGQRPGLPAHDKVFTGDYLMKVGIKLLTDRDMTSRIVELTRE